MGALLAITFLWTLLNAFAILLMVISDKRFDYFIEFMHYFYCKNILDFILRVVILFAYLPFNIGSLIKEVINE